MRSEEAQRWLDADDIHTARLEAEIKRLRGVLEKILSWNEAIQAGRGNHHAVDHINLISTALSSQDRGAS